jgi:hypothetical protein
VTRYRVPPHVLRGPLESDEVLLNTETGVYHLINETGRMLFSSFEAGMTLEEGAERLSEERDEPLDRVLVDARRFARAMVERRLLEELRE